MVGSNLYPANYVHPLVFNGNVRGEASMTSAGKLREQKCLGALRNTLPQVCCRWSPTVGGVMPRCPCHASGRGEAWQLGELPRELEKTSSEMSWTYDGFGPTAFASAP
ncbi:hypothetical protein GQ53DRAFT_748918 [Thozetella sp. PMI_491]|nr:hypothetical protein GQ53DRAFT_748918 [Thozetella sp. PMI_491]